MRFYENRNKPDRLQNRLFNTRRQAIVRVVCCVVFWAGVIAFLVVLTKGAWPALF